MATLPAARRGWHIRPTRGMLEPHGSDMKATGAVRVGGLTVAAFAASVLLLAATAAAAGSAGARDLAHASRVLNVRDEGRLRFIHASGSTLIDEGHVSGTFAGSVKVRFLYNGEPNVSARFTITGSGGSISARGSGRLSSPVSATPSFRGHMQITGGSGRYSHVRGSGELFGVFNRRTYALSVQAIGKLPF
jgi:hypothetical protein